MLLHLFALLTAVSTAVLIFAGGLVTSTGSGLSVPDWPNSYGWFMFTFPLENWVGGIFYEHSHRLIASTVGFLILVLAFWLWRAEPRRWVRRLGFIALGAVITQGVLGGITVLWYLPDAISIAHASLAEIVFCLTTTIALVTSPGWRARYARRGPAPDDRRLQHVALATLATVYLQIVVGATMRHTDAGLAIPDFPWMFGHLVPDHWDPKIAIHFAHRAGALCVTLMLLATTGHVFARHRNRLELLRPSILLLGLVTLQITLGAFTVLSRKEYIINSLHVVTGASVLVTTLILTLRAHRARFGDVLGPAGRVAGTRLTAGPDHSGAADWVTLTKPRLNLLVLITTLAGLYLAEPAGVSTSLLVNTLLGSALVAGGAAALNQVFERTTDALMRRTRNRPLAAGRLGSAEGSALGAVLSIAGLVELALFTNLTAAAVAAVTLASYVFVYTPLKTRTSLATLIGAVPGALPPVIGWAAATGSISGPAIVLFGIVFLWQMPHFLAIAWMYRDDYARAGIPLLPVLEPDGRRTGYQALLYAAVLWPVSLLPVITGLAGLPYAAVATVLGFLYIGLSVRFAQERSPGTARRLFLFSILYLTLLLGALVANRVWM